MVSPTGATSIEGSLEPPALHRLKRDPATACGPFVTMFNDIFGTTVYFLIATIPDFTTKK
jgi:magnesium transporter